MDSVTILSQHQPTTHRYQKMMRLKLFCIFANSLVVFSDSSFALQISIPTRGYSQRYPFSSETRSNEKGGQSFSQYYASTNTSLNASASKIKTPATDPYYLVWSPKFGRRFVICTLVIFVFRRTISKGVFMIPRGGPLSEALNDLVLPLLASSCCILQLVANVIATSSGCLGFNKILGPFRPFFLSLLCFFSRGVMTSICFRWVVALLPELIHSLNVRPWLSQAEVYSQEATNHVRWFVEIPTMGCVACVQKINASLQKMSNVVKVESVLNTDGAKGGRTIVTFARSEEDNASNVQAAIEGAGFPVVSVQKSNP